MVKQSKNSFGDQSLTSKHITSTVVHVEQCYHCLKSFRETKLCRIESEKGQPKVCVSCYKVWRAMADLNIRR